MRLAAQANPPSIPQLIRLLEAASPAVAAAVKANMEGFISMLFEPLEVHPPHEHPLTWGDWTGNFCNVCEEEAESMFFFCEACDCALPLALSPPPPPPPFFLHPAQTAHLYTQGMSARRASRQGRLSWGGGLDLESLFWFHYNNAPEPQCGAAGL